MKKKRIVILTVFIVLNILSSQIGSVLAQGYDHVTFQADTQHGLSDRTQTTHQATGKHCYGYWDTGDEAFYILIYSNEGTHEATPTQAIDWESYGRLNLYDYEHSTDILIIACSRLDLDVVEARLYTLNVNTYIITYVGELHLSVEVESRRPAFSERIMYDDDVYVIYHMWDGDDNTGEFGWIKYDTTTLTGSVVTNSTIDEGGNAGAIGLYEGYPVTMAVQDPTYQNQIYFITTEQGDEDKPVAYRCDLDGGASSIEKLADCAISGNYQSWNEEGLAQWSIHNINSGVRDTGGYRYLYFTYTYGGWDAQDFRYLHVNQWRLVFNTTDYLGDIVNDNLTANNLKYGFFALGSLGASGSNVAWNTGYLDEWDVSNEDDYYYVYAPHDTGGTADTIKFRIRFDDWYSTDDNEYLYTYEILDFIDEDCEVYEPRTETHGHVWRDWNGYYQTDYNPSNDEWRIWYGLSAIIETYDITISYAPSDDPLLTDTRYIFTITSTRNGIGTQVINGIYWDDAPIRTAETNGAGVYNLPITNSFGGYHNLTVSIWDGTPTVFKYSESFIYFFEFDEEDETTTPALVTATTVILVNALPVLIMILFPTLAFYQAFGNEIFGGLFGMTLGVVLCNISQMLPTYTVYLAILIDIALVIQEVRGQ